MTHEFLKELLQSPWAGIVSFTLALASIVLAFVFYRKSKRDRRPCYSVASRLLVSAAGANLDGLEVLVKGVLQEQVTVAKVAFWNAGQETIRARDIAPTAPIEVSLKGGATLLSASVLHETEPSISVMLGDPKVLPAYGKTVAQTRIPVTFDYLDRNQGFIIQVAHSGDSTHPIRMFGKILGVKKLERIPSPINRRRRTIELMEKRMSERAFWFIGICFCLAFLVGAILAAVFSQWWVAVPIILIGCLYCWAMITEYRGDGIPQDLLERQS